MCYSVICHSHHKKGRLNYITTRTKWPQALPTLKQMQSYHTLQMQTLELCLLDYKAPICYIVDFKVSDQYGSPIMPSIHVVGKIVKQRCKAFTAGTQYITYVSMSMAYKERALPHSYLSHTKQKGLCSRFVSSKPAF